MWNHQAKFLIGFFHKHFQITDAVLSGANEMISKINVVVSDDRKQLNEDKSIVKNQIPTAIVKPKYQRSSFDDRQLPAVAYMNDDHLAWYDKPNTIDTSKCSTSMAPALPKKIHLPEFDRNAKKHIKSTNSANSAHNAVETAHNKQISATDNTVHSSDGKVSDCQTVTNRAAVQKSKKKGASVAVVQPRKKERMDERKLMETIVQMQIKKNAQLYRGQYNNNKPNNTNANTISASIKTSSVIQTDGNMKYLNNNNINNNNNGENNTNAELNQAKKDRKDNSGMNEKAMQIPKWI